jgi:hypothetical protein
MVTTEAPRIDRQVSLRFRGDWGQANLTRICSWLSQEMWDRTARGSEFSIWSGRGGMDQIDALRAGEVDVAIVTPASLAALARSGSPDLGIPPFPELRGLGSFGHDDRLIMAVDAALPVASAGDLLAVADQLIIATCPDDGINGIGLVGHRALALAGAPMEELIARGARVIYDERPFPGLHDFATAKANVVIQEAIMMPAWQRLGAARAIRYVPWGDEVLRGMESLGLGAKNLRAGYLPGQDEEFPTIDFSDFLLVCRDDLDGDIAALLVWCMVKTRVSLEVQYRALPPDRTPLTYPIDPLAIRKSPIPLHPAAEHQFDTLVDTTPLTEGLIWT